MYQGLHTHELIASARTAAPVLGGLAVSQPK